MRDFSDTDSKNKGSRIKLPDNPDNLTAETRSQVEHAIRAALKDGYLACPSGWKIAKNAGVSRLDVGAMIDKLGVRVTDCQLGCFKVSKAASTSMAIEPCSDEAARRIEFLGDKGELTCSNVFTLALELKVKPMSLAAAANCMGHKTRHCQLGCF
jgi:hypothetical protein